MYSHNRKPVSCSSMISLIMYSYVPGKSAIMRQTQQLGNLTRNALSFHETSTHSAQL